MQSKILTFRARARTIEHLGKGQIADCPTAVSELWKNSYDAYARDVSLYTIDSDSPCGALIDNGCGMSLDQLVDSWLMVGTESKSRKEALNPSERFGLDVRKTQGEKGIGRLSAAFLSPVTFMVTKKTTTHYTAILIDWRLFENPYLSFEDIPVPSIEFNSLDNIQDVFESLIKDLHIDITTSDGDAFKARAWERYTSDEYALASDKQKFISTKDRVINFCSTVKFDVSIVSPWRELLDKVALLDGEAHGTALFLFELNRELSLLTNAGDMANDNVELNDIKKDLVDTLRAFTNPLVDIDDIFSYEIFVIKKDGGKRSILRQKDVFNNSDFNSLEHTIIGNIDEKGWFRGTVKAFGEDKGDIVIPPTISLAPSEVGPFEIKIGTFEIIRKNGTLPERIHANLKEKADIYAGLMVFRDSLRVLPYGRVDNDFFQIEERRSLNAGRYYWSNRRIFGFIGISQSKNRELKDKSGREGFIKNQAARELKILVSDLLTTLSDRFFGGKSEDRQEILSALKKDKEQRKIAQHNARKSTQRSFALALKNQTPLLNESLTKLIKLREQLNSINENDIDIIQHADNLLCELESIKPDIRTPVKPPKLGIHEEKYRSYRDKYNEFTVHVLQSKKIINNHLSAFHKLEPSQLVKQHLDRNQGILNSKLNKFSNMIQVQLNALSKQWEGDIKNDRCIYYSDAIKILDAVSDGSDVESALNTIDSIYFNLLDSLNFKYQSILKILDRLSEGVNLESAFSISEEEREFFETKTTALNALAQLGISVEIISHELEEIDYLVTRGLNSLPANVREHPGYEMAFNAHKSLTQQIRFLSPLKLSGYQSRQEITGKNIFDHVTKFFGDRFSKQRIEFTCGDAFKSMCIIDVPSRIYPVFTNLLNNALYWVCLSERREIKIDLINDLVVIANSGPSIDEDDIQKLFTIFYSKRANGNGVGLYLCRENLSVAHHEIWYSDPSSNDPYLIKNGANFIIKFNRLESKE
ncbi:ATP-binding protein [Aeromonas veronii]